MVLRILSLTLLASMAYSQAASGGILFGGGRQSKQLYKIEPDTGARTPTPFAPQLLPGFPGFNGLAFNTRDGYLYGTITNLTGFPGPRSPGIGTNLYRIDPTTFSVQTLQITGLTLQIGESIDGLEYDRGRNVFWATVPAKGELVRIDATTLGATVVSDGLFPAVISGIAYDESTDTLYGVDDFGGGGSLSRLLAIDLTTFDYVQIGPAGLGLGLNDLDSLAFDPVGGWLYSINDTAPTVTRSQQLVRIDRSTGLATAIGPPYVTIEAYQGLAFIVPEPGTGFLAFSAFWAAALSWRSRSSAPR